ncbi:MAG: metal-sensitive transcriptional regulator [Candidatus Humimicrobiaceae bacterium]
MVKSKKMDTKEDVIKRLRRIEGQVKGIQKMIAEDKYCVDILTQVAAIRAAINKVGSILLEKHSMRCIEDATSSEERTKSLNELAKTVQAFMKFAD